MEPDNQHADHNQQKPRLRPALTDRRWLTLWAWLLAPEAPGEEEPGAEQGVEPGCGEE